MILQLEGVFSGYRPEHDVLRNLTLAVPRGGVVSIIGPNGAGKSTIFKTIFGFLRAKAGRILFDPSEPSGRNASIVPVRLGVGLARDLRIGVSGLDGVSSGNLQVGRAPFERARASFARVLLLLPAEVPCPAE